MRLCYRLVCLVVPVKKRRLVFISYPDAADNSWHLYSYMVEHVEGFEFVWLCGQPSNVRERIQQESQRSGRNTILVARRLSVKGIFLLMTARLIFTSCGVSRFVGRARGRTVVNLWHGMPIKAVGYLYPENHWAVSFCDYTLSTSPLYTRVMAGVFNIPESRVLEVGLPRNDALLAERTPAMRAAIFEALGVEAEADVIFWLPTFRRTMQIGERDRPREDSSESSFLDEWGCDLFEKLDAAAQAGGCKVIIKLHPADRLNNEAPVIDYDHIKLLTASAWASLGVDLYEALAVSAALISDISSVLIDYIAVNKPIAVTMMTASAYSRGLIPAAASILTDCQQVRSQVDLLQFIVQHRVTNYQSSVLCKYNNTCKVGACEDITSRYVLDKRG